MILLLNVYKKAAVNSHTSLSVAWEWSMLVFRILLLESSVLYFAGRMQIFSEERFSKTEGCSVGSLD